MNKILLETTNLKKAIITLTAQYLYLIISI